MSGTGENVVFEQYYFAGAKGQPLVNARKDVLLRQRSIGRTTVVSVDRNGVPAAGDSYDAAISPNGRYVCFSSTASNLVADDRNGTADVFVRDLTAGTTVLASVRGRIRADASSRYCAVTDDGDVAFLSSATNLVDVPPTEEWAVYLHNRASGENQLAFDPGSFIVRLRAGGGVVVATGWFPQPVTSSKPHVIVYDSRTGVTELPDLALVTPPGRLRFSVSGDVSKDGRIVVFESFVDGVKSLPASTYIWNRVSGSRARIAAPGGVSPNGAIVPIDLPPDGQTLLLAFNATVFVAGAPARATYVYDVPKRTFSLRLPFGIADQGRVSDHGRVVGFMTNQQLVSGDTNHLDDVYVSVR